MCSVSNAEASPVAIRRYARLIAGSVVLLLLLFPLDGRVRAEFIQKPYWGHAETSISFKVGDHFTVQPSVDEGSGVLETGTPWLPFEGIIVAPNDTWSSSSTLAIPSTGVTRFSAQAYSNYAAGSNVIPGMTVASGTGTVYVCSFWTVDAGSSALQPGDPVELAVDCAIDGLIDFGAAYGFTPGEPTHVRGGLGLDSRLGLLDNAYWLDGTPWQGDWFETNPFPDELLLLARMSEGSSGPSADYVDWSGSYDAQAAVGDVVVLETRLRWYVYIDAENPATEKWVGASFSDTLTTELRATTPGAQLVAYVPEPSTLLMALAGIAGFFPLLCWRRTDQGRCGAA